MLESRQQNASSSAEEMFRFKRMLAECAEFVHPDIHAQERIKYLEARVKALKRSAETYRNHWRSSRRTIDRLKKLRKYEFGIEVYNCITHNLMRRMTGFSSAAVVRRECRLMAKDVADKSIIYTPIYRTVSKWQRLYPQNRVKN